jgi:hypothetical protein
LVEPSVVETSTISQLELIYFNSADIERRYGVSFK